MLINSFWRETPSSPSVKFPAGGNAAPATCAQTGSRTPPGCSPFPPPAPLLSLSPRPRGPGKPRAPRRSRAPPAAAAAAARAAQGAQGPGGAPLDGAGHPAPGGAGGLAGSQPPTRAPSRPGGPGRAVPKRDPEGDRRPLAVRGAARGRAPFPAARGGGPGLGPGPGPGPWAATALPSLARPRACRWGEKHRGELLRGKHERAFAGLEAR